MGGATPAQLGIPCAHPGIDWGTLDPLASPWGHLRDLLSSSWVPHGDPLARSAVCMEGVQPGLERLGCTRLKHPWACKKTWKVAHRRLLSGPQGLHSGAQRLHSGPQGLHSGPQGLLSGTQGLHSGAQGLRSDSQELHSDPQGAAFWPTGSCILARRSRILAHRGRVSGPQGLHSGPQGAPF